MKRFFLRPLHSSTLWLIVTIVVITGMAFWMSVTAVHALPEYATRTGESCAACHVSAGGGGPRTLRGLLWAARGRPDKVPALPNMLIAPRVDDPAEMYDIACAGCHGLRGEGLFAIELVGRNYGAGAARTFILDGIPSFGMPGFEGQFTDAQLNALVKYVTGLGNGSIPPPLNKYPLQPGHLTCQMPECAPTTAASKGN